ncbi:TlpA family protein disulfide reductase [Thermoleophilia bacterium SCSIO 60948]|nr:TlpA family protein disulfide reductase [Thermoleophilia bacterium SCSIO 60948]
MSARAISVLVLVVALVGLLAWGLAARSPDALAIGEPVGEEGEPGGPPLPLLADAADGVAEPRTASLSDFEGKWVLVNVWASWCDPCIDEAPDLERFYRQNRSQDFEVVGIDTKDASGDGMEFAEEFDLTYPLLHDGGGTFADDVLKTTGVPENFLLDPQGNLVTYVRGPVDTAFLDDQIKPLIRGSS